VNPQANTRLDLCVVLCGVCEGFVRERDEKDHVPVLTSVDILNFDIPTMERRIASNIVHTATTIGLLATVLENMSQQFVIFCSKTYRREEQKKLESKLKLRGALLV
jgi:hypothetical protein